MKQTLYHASNVAAEHPDTKHSREFLDFGRGFYLTSIREQAKKYAERFIRRHQDAYLNTYILEAEENDWRILEFKAYDKEWLDFVSNCRSRKLTEEYDMVVGSIANDKVFYA